MLKNPSANAGDVGLTSGLARSPEEMATHSSILAWKIPWTEDPGGIQSTGSQEDMKWRDWAHTHTRGRRPDLLCFRPYESRPSSVRQETSHQEPNSWHINLGLPSLLIYSGPAVLRLFNLHTHPKSVFQLHFPQWCFWIHISASLGEVWLS